jgi:hypothetical protein
MRREGIAPLDFAGNDSLTLILGIDLHELGIKLIDEIGMNGVDKRSFGRHGGKGFKMSETT